MLALLNSLPKVSTLIVCDFSERLLNQFKNDLLSVFKNLSAGNNRLTVIATFSDESYFPQEIFEGVNVIKAGKAVEFSQMIDLMSNEILNRELEMEVFDCILILSSSNGEHLQFVAKNIDPFIRRMRLLTSREICIVKSTVRVPLELMKRQEDFPILLGTHFSIGVLFDFLRSIQATEKVHVRGALEIVESNAILDIKTI